MGEQTYRFKRLLSDAGEPWLHAVHYSRPTVLLFNHSRILAATGT